MDNTQIRALLSVHSNDCNNKFKYIALYYCDEKSASFFEDVFIPLFADCVEFKRITLEADIQKLNNLINVVIHTPKDLLTGFAKSTKDVNLFAQELLNASTVNTNSNNGRRLAPIIHISLVDFFRDSLYDTIPAPLSLPRSYPILDSSIWNYLVFINNIPSQFKHDFLSVVDEIYQNYGEQLYDLEISCEYADLNSRLLKEAFLGGGHAKGVSPFVFHSEKRIRIEANKLLSGINRYGNLRWRFLLLDDKVETDKGDDYFLTLWNQGKSSKTKTEILINRITDIGFTCEAFKTPPRNSKCQIEIIYVDTVKKALRLMRKYQFDIILLDYLLKDDYGYRLLQEVEDDNSIKGPHGELFFMFISAFTTAVSERLTFEGLSRNKREKWQIGEGACPTNTPELFKYRLLQLMSSRLRQTCIDDLSYDSILQNLKYIFETNEIGDDQDYRNQRIKSIRKRAYDKYRVILGLHYDYFTLKEDENKSVLIKSFMQNKVHLDALLEHLLQFIHLIAFGTVRQWPEIWEEYQFIVRTLNVPDSDIRGVSKLIEKHIIDLKSA